MNIKKFLKALSALALVGALSACNTIEGAGKDIQKAGSNLSETARDCKDANGC